MTIILNGTTGITTPGLDGDAVGTDVQPVDSDLTALTPEELKARVPTVVTMRQARLALLQSGLLAQVEAAIAGIEDAGQRQAVQIEWEYAAEVNRTHPWVQTLSTALGLSEEQLDQLFIQASTL